MSRLRPTRARSWRRRTPPTTPTLDTLRTTGDDTSRPVAQQDCPHDGPLLNDCVSARCAGCGIRFADARPDPVSDLLAVLTDYVTKPTPTKETPMEDTTPTTAAAQDAERFAITHGSDNEMTLFIYDRTERRPYRATINGGVDVWTEGAGWQEVLRGVGGKPFAADRSSALWDHDDDDERRRALIAHAIDGARIAANILNPTAD